ncbi:MAG: FAD-dependent oxidoreductase [Thermodesulfovibrio sp.]|nr:FAD-dependent oxidoreductase [Thermodesulfovibrio sp.]
MSTDRKGPVLSRRTFLQKSLIKGALLTVSAAGLTTCRGGPPGQMGKSGVVNKYRGGIAGSNWKAGHMLLQHGPLTPTETEKTGIIIVGGGIAGLSAAREISKKQFKDFLVLELEEKAGGNAISGANAVSPYPWGAHYIPIPSEEATFTRELFEELGVIEGYNSRGLPLYNEYYLCSDPHERLFIHGRWQEGLIPHLGISEDDRRQHAEFFSAMEQFRRARGNDGRRAFAIPLELSSRDSRFRSYDTLSMSRFMADSGWNSEPLRWYVNYCCRDDYGTRLEETSAWAGIHYFASRNGRAANADSPSVLTWPEGLGWIVGKLGETMSGNIRGQACVLNIEATGNEVAVDYYDIPRGKVVRVLAGTVIYAAPRFTAFKTIKSFRDKLPAYADCFGYTPWMVANVTMKGQPEGVGTDLSWDNVSYYNDSLGYIVANHQSLARHREKTVLTCYFPLTAGEPPAERQKALKRTYDEWSAMVVQDLSRMHPGIEKSIEEVNVWIWGHAMIRPMPGLIWGRARQEAMKPLEKIHFAHSDMSGISIFEEAQYRGIMAARAALREFTGNNS